MFGNFPSSLSVTCKYIFFHGISEVDALSQSRQTIRAFSQWQMSSMFHVIALPFSILIHTELRAKYRIGLTIQGELLCHELSHKKELHLS